MIKRVRFADKGQTLKEISVFVGDSMAMVARTVPEWIFDAYQGMLVDASSLKLGERIRFFSFDNGTMETTVFEIEKITTHKDFNENNDGKED